MNRKLFNSFYVNLLSGLCLIFLSGCNNDDPAPDFNSNNVQVNEWILDNMNFWYFWNESIPSKVNKNQEPDAFFKSLLHSQDRFSWIQDNYSELLKSLQGISKEGGYEFVLYRESPGSNNVVAQILYVKKNSPAEQANLKRGDLITHINNTRLTADNYRSLLGEMKENHSLRYQPLIIGQEKFDTEKTVNLTTVELSENPNHLYSVINHDDKKIGYYVYTFFASGTDNHVGQYDQEMVSIFQDFKTQGITDLVLDLRFNSGGSERAAKTLASLIGLNVDSLKVFFKREYNPKVTQEIKKEPNSESFLTSRFATITQNIGSQLSNNRVYILTSSRTASASELIINGLRPYMDVYLIGDTTYGKNVGSISLFDENDPKNNWGMQPIILKAYNSLSQSDYDNGFLPNVVNPDNSLYIYPLGDEREALLSEAIAQITGDASLGRRRVPAYEREIISHSADFKKRSFRLVIESNIPEMIHQ